MALRHSEVPPTLPRVQAQNNPAAIITLVFGDASLIQDSYILIAQRYTDLLDCGNQPGRIEEITDTRVPLLALQQSTMSNGMKLKSLDAVQKSLDSVTSDPKNGVAGMVFAAVDKNGEYITANASGNKGLATDKPMDLETVFWIASCTKILATIVCMQLVEQGKLTLDDHKSLYKLCPELEKVQVLQNGKLVPKTKDITLRMLLSHTAGFGYEFFNHGLRDYGRPIGYDCFSGNVDEILAMPLVNQPGSRWEYGVSTQPLSSNPITS